MTLETIEEELKTIYAEIYSQKLSTKTNQERKELRARVNKLLELKEILTSEKIATDDEIDIYETTQSHDTKRYKITLHNQLDVIGYIRVTYLKNVTMRQGNIGYEINEKYRGHNYTIRALEMLSDIIYEKGLSKPIISANIYNSTSNHIIQKFGW